MLYLSENLRTFRTMQNLTQEEVAEALGVSAQAVSRWETGSACPDVELLPALANFYHVTLDTLVGMERMRTEDSLENIFTRAHNLVKEKRYEETVSLLRHGLTLYPGNWGLLSELSLALPCLGTSEAVREAVSTGEKVLAGCMSEPILATTRAGLCRSYALLGEREKALSAVRRLPHVWECREAAFGLCGEELSDKGIRILLAVLADRLRGVETNLMLGYNGKEDLADVAALVEKYVTTPNCNPQK